MHPPPGKCHHYFFQDGGFIIPGHCTIYIYTWKANCHLSLDEKVKPNRTDMEAFWTSVSGPYAASEATGMTNWEYQDDRHGCWQLPN